MITVYPDEALHACDPIPADSIEIQNDTCGSPICGGIYYME